MNNEIERETERERERERQREKERKKECLQSLESMTTRSREFLFVVKKGKRNSLTCHKGCESVIERGSMSMSMSREHRLT